MIRMHAYKSEQLLTMSFSQQVRTDEMERCAHKTRDVLVGMNPGFRLLTNLSALEYMEPACAPHVETIMGLCDEKEIGMDLRVIPDATKDIGYSIMSQFHYKSAVDWRTYENLADAMKRLRVVSPSAGTQH